MFLPAWLARLRCHCLPVILKRNARSTPIGSKSAHLLSLIRRIAISLTLARWLTLPLTRVEQRTGPSTSPLGVAVFGKPRMGATIGGQKPISCHRSPLEQLLLILETPPSCMRERVMPSTTGIISRLSAFTSLLMGAIRGQFSAEIFLQTSPSIALCCPCRTCCWWLLPTGFINHPTQGQITP